MAGNIKIVVDVGLARDPVTVMDPIVEAAKAATKKLNAEEKARVAETKKAEKEKLKAAQDNERAKLADHKSKVAEANRVDRERIALIKQMNAIAAADEKTRMSQGVAFLKLQQKNALDAVRLQIRMRNRLEREAAAERREIARRELADQRAAARESARQKREMAAIERDVQRRIDRDAKQAQRESARNAKMGGNTQAPGFFSTSARPGFLIAGAAMAGGLAAVGAAAYKGAKWAAGAIGANTDMASHVQSAMDLESSSVALSNQSYMAGQPGDAGVRQDPRRLRQEVRATADMAAMDPNEVMGGLQKFVAKTGDLRMGRDLMADMAKLSKATDANFDNMIDAAADAANQLKDTEGAAESVKEVMRGVAGQGKLGAVEIKDMAVQMAKVAAAASRYGGDRKRNILLMSAFAQEARERGGAASAPQAATAVQSFTAQFSKGKRLDALHKMGVKTHDDAGNILDAQSIMTSLLQKTRGDPRKMQGGIADQQAQRVTNGFAEIYRNTYASTSGTDTEKMAAATAAYTAELERLMEATIKDEEIERSFALAMETSKSRVQLFNNSLAKVGEELLQALMPAFEQLAPHIIGMAQAFSALVDWVFTTIGVENPNKAAALYATGEAAISGGAAVNAGLQGDLHKFRHGENSVETGRFNAVTGNFEGGVYNPEHVAVGKAKLSEMQDALTKEQAALAKEWRPPQYMHNGVPSKELFGDKLYGGYATPELQIKGNNYDQHAAAVGALRAEAAKLAGTLGVLDSMKQGSALKVVVVNQPKKPGPFMDPEGTTDSAKEATQ